MELPHKRVWNFSTKPFKLEPRNGFKCLFCNGDMVISHGQVFQFELGLHGDAKKRSYAVDTWMYCYDCKWTVVHGVAIPKEVYDDFTEMVFNAPRINVKGEPMDEKPIKKEIPVGMSATIFPQDVNGKKRKKAKERWGLRDDIQGAYPLFPMTCKMCTREGEMFLRHSKMHIIRRDKLIKKIKLPFSKGKQLRLYQPATATNQTSAFRISYKCPECDWLSTFVVPVPDDYFKKILDMRGGEPLYYPPLDKWESDDELIQRKLESLGYV
jgi:hypothetical protein